MNLTLLIKLVKLANNNPNDNEANLAARKVCRMIAEGDYKFNQPPISNPMGNSPPPGYTPPPSQGFNPFEDMLNYRWGGFDQAKKEESWTSNPYEPRAKPYEPPTGYPINEYDPLTGKRKEKPKRNLTCSVCKKDIWTIFQGLESVFECNTCIWEAYARGKK